MYVSESVCLSICTAWIILVFVAHERTPCEMIKNVFDIIFQDSYLRIRLSFLRSWVSNGVVP